MNRELSIAKLKNELYTELISILDFWRSQALDVDHGGFHGCRDFENKLVKDANKGIILNTRIFWSFAASGNFLDTPEYDKIVKRAFDYLKGSFWDKENGGVFWELDCAGQVINDRKQIYAQAFAMYALSEYYLLAGVSEAKSLAMEIFELIESHSLDSEKAGYLEAFSRDWGRMEDMRLSEKDLNAAKTMNTHLHIMEAYTSLFKIYPVPRVRQALEQLVRLINRQFLTAKGQFHLFFDRDWQLQSNIVSFGHDIESAWLILIAAEGLGDAALIQECKKNAIQIADTFLAEGVDVDGSVLNERNDDSGHLDTDRHWWPQVEAMIGLAYAYKITKNEKYLDPIFTIWEFVKASIKDAQNGEWHFRVDAQGKAYPEDKISMWKAPYHSTRACMVLNTIL